MEENTSNENRKKSGLLWILIALLAITNGVTFWMYTQEKNKAANEIIVKEQVIVERDNVKSELLQLQKDYGNLQTNDKALQAEIDAKKAQEASPQQAANEAFRKTQQPEPIKIVELDDVIQSQTLSPEQQKDGIKFFFGEIGVLTFPDKSTYHVRSHTAFITDPLVIHNIKTFAESNPGQKIFIQ